MDAEHHLGAVVAAPEWLKVDGFFFIGVSLLKAKLFLEATKTRPNFSLPKVIIQVQTGLEYSTG